MNTRRKPLSEAVLLPHHPIFMALVNSGKNMGITREETEEDLAGLKDEIPELYDLYMQAVNEVYGK